MSNFTEITKTYGRKISVDYSSWDFSTTIKKTFDAGEITTKEKFIEENEKLFGQVKAMTEVDIKKYEHELTPKKV